LTSREGYVAGLTLAAIVLPLALVAARASYRWVELRGIAWCKAALEKL
jgi:hypothetical protein